VSRQARRSSPNVGCWSNSPPHIPSSRGVVSRLQTEVLTHRSRGHHCGNLSPQSHRTRRRHPLCGTRPPIGSLVSVARYCPANFRYGTTISPCIIMPMCFLSARWRGVLGRNHRWTRGSARRPTCDHCFWFGRPLSRLALARAVSRCYSGAAAQQATTAFAPGLCDDMPIRCSFPLDRSGEKRRPHSIGLASSNRNSPRRSVIEMNSCRLAVRPCLAYSVRRERWGTHA
jgi:hypothetical protein